jgi:hypothetical protein
MTRPLRLCGFTLIELLVICVSLLLLFCLFLPSAYRAKRARDKRCYNNLRQIGLAFKTWPADIDWFPARMPVSSGGAKEYVEAGKVFFNFTVMSNELLGDPRVLVCPWDNQRRAAKTFGPAFGDTNLSYFVGLDSDDTLPQSFLSGDRNLAFSGRPLGHGLFVLKTSTVLTWTKDIHKSCGNILLGDGSAHFLDQERLVKAIRNQGIPTNRLAVP